MKKLLLLCVIACFAATTAFAADDDDENKAADRLKAAGTVLDEIQSAHREYAGGSGMGSIIIEVVS